MAWYLARRDILRAVRAPGILGRWTKSRASTRGEVEAIMFALADMTVDVRTIRGLLEGDAYEEEEEDLPDA